MSTRLPFLTWFLILLENSGSIWSSIFFSKICVSSFPHYVATNVCILSSANTRINSLWLVEFLLVIFKMKKRVMLFNYSSSVIKALLELCVERVNWILWGKLQFFLLWMRPLSREVVLWWHKLKMNWVIFHLSVNAEMCWKWLEGSKT